MTEVINDQHFLEDESILDKIVDNFDCEGLVLEVGPGRGALTKRLIARGNSVIAVEKDLDMCNFLRKKMKVPFLSEDLIIEEGNILDLKFSMFKCKNIISNLPYSISEAFFYKLVKEGMEKIVLTTGSNFYDLLVSDDKLGIYCKEFFEIKKICDVPKSAFNPPPKVESTSFKLVRKKLSFAGKIIVQMDKKLKNALVDVISRDSTKREAKSKLEGLGISEDILSKRIMHLSNKQFKDVYDKLVKL